MQERCDEDDYNVVKDMVPRWMEEDAGAMKRSFVLVI